MCPVLTPQLSRSSYIQMVLSPCFLQKSWKDRDYPIGKMSASPTKRPLWCCPYLQAESCPTYQGLFLFLIVMFHPLCLSPSAVLLHSYIFLTGPILFLALRQVRFFSLCPFKNNNTYMVPISIFFCIKLTTCLLPITVL